MASSTGDVQAISTNWLKSLEVASSTGDTAAFANHFLPDGWFRDLLCLSWRFRTLSGQESIREFLSEVVDGKSRFESAGLRNFKLDDHTVNSPSPLHLPGPPIEGVQGAFTFDVTSPAAYGRGFFRLVQDADGSWKALTLFTSMQDLVGYEESSADQHDVYTDRKITWEDTLNAKFHAIETDPTVVIVGAGQSGLMCAAQLGRLGIRALLIEKHARVGDSWRTRYPNLTLHTPAYQSSMLYSPYPTNFPKYIPKGKLANFLESYAVNHEICMWLSSTITSTPVYDPVSGRWTVDVQHGNRKEILNPKHLILATGNGSPRIPVWSGMSDFQGDLYHSDFHKDAERFRGKRVVVVGAGNASCDICQNFAAHGAAEITIVQRSATFVISAAAAEQTHFRLPFSTPAPVEELDFFNNSLPVAFLIKLLKPVDQHIKMLDKELHDNLSKAGFKVTSELSPGSGEVGLLSFVYDRAASGTMLDVGCSKLIIDGRVKIKQGQDISHFDKEGVVFKDGSKLLADVIVLATGNEPMVKGAQALLGDKIVDQLSPPQVWGINAEGELNQVYQRSGHPGLWFAIGAFAYARFLSKHLGLQILAQEVGIAQ